MSRYQRHVFVCVNRRPPGDRRGCCAAKGSEHVRALFKDGLRSRGLAGVVRANAAGCLDACATGTTVVIYPEAVWYGGVTAADVEEIIERHILRGEIIERLLSRPPDGGPRRHPPLTRPSL
ncbi:MAG: ferredoxin [Acidobacteriota bacterium]